MSIPIYVYIIYILTLIYRSEKINVSLDTNIFRKLKAEGQRERKSHVSLTAINRHGEFLMQTISMLHFIADFSLPLQRHGENHGSGTGSQRLSGWASLHRVSQSS